VEKAAYDEVLQEANHFTNMNDFAYSYWFPEELVKASED